MRSVRSRRRGERPDTSQENGLRRRRRLAHRGALIALAGAVALPLSLISIFSVPGAGAAPGPNTRVPVPGGVNPAALPNVKVFGTTTPATPETVSVILKTNLSNQLEAQVEAGVTHFLSTAQFAATYSQTLRFIGQLRSYLAGFGIATTVYADDLDVHATGTAGAFDAAFTVHQRNYHVPPQPGPPGFQHPRGQNVHAPTSTPLLPRYLADHVEAILGLDNYAPYVSLAANPNIVVGHTIVIPTTPTCKGGDPDACHVPADFAQTYGLDGLYANGADGQGQTIGIVTLAALNVGAPTYFWYTYLHMTPSGRTVSVVTVDGGPGAPSAASGSSETDLDTEQSGALAPGANVIVYQAPNTTTGFVDAFYRAATTNVASDISVSWGEAETVIQYFTNAGLLTAGYIGAFDEAFEEMAMQGQSMFAASGDGGAYTDWNQLGTTNLVTDVPASSPFLTAAGGTTLPLSLTYKTTEGTSVHVTVDQQRTWATDYLWQPLATLTHLPEVTIATSHTWVAGGGGGYSGLEPRPSYQQGVPGVQRYSYVEYLTPETYIFTEGLSLPTKWTFDPTPRVQQGYAPNGRAVPDVSADADPQSGYLLYGAFNTTTGNTVSMESHWGGTSFIAPQLNGATAVLDSALGHRVGFWNPDIYGFATGRNSPFTPLNRSGTTNDDLYYTGTRGTDYNAGSGLGTPTFTALERSFASMGRGPGPH